MGAVMQTLSIGQKLFGFQGRITRLDFWLAQLFYVVMIFTAVFGMAALARSVGDGASSRLTLGGIMIVGYIALFWSSLAVSIKRYHDRGKSGWWVLLSLIPIVALFVLIELGFFEGTRGTNRFGPSPKGLVETDLAKTGAVFE